MSSDPTPDSRRWWEPGPVTTRRDRWRLRLAGLLCRLYFGRNCPHIPGIGAHFFDV